MSFFSEYLIPILLGIGLSAACGLRVFLPVFAVSLLSYFGHIPLSENFQWLATLPAVIAFGAATLLEIVAYYVPWLDHLLDSITIPSSVAGGTMLLASVNPELEPLIKWTLALIAGGGTAGIFSTAAAVSRVKSTAVSGGATNFIVATVENIGSVFLTAISLFLPVLAGIIIVIFLYFCVQLIVRAKRTVAGLKGGGE